MSSTRLVVLGVVTAACATAPPPAVAPPPPAVAPPPTATAAPTPPAAAASDEAPPGMQWVRAQRFSLLVPDDAEEVETGHWRVGADPASTRFDVGVTVMPYGRDTDTFVREQLGNPSLAALVLDADVEAPRGGVAWRRWRVDVPGATSEIMGRIRYLVSGNRTVFAMCLRLDALVAQEALCDRVLGSLRVGARAAAATQDPALTTVAVDEGAIDVPNTWRRIPGQTGAMVPTERSPPEQAEMAVFLAVNPNTADLQVVMEGTLTGARNQNNATVDVRERRVQGRGARAEGTLRYRLTTRRDPRAAIGRALVRAGHGAMVLCSAPAGAEAEACERAVDSFEVAPR